MALKTSSIRTLAVMTSGGDAPGMNAALRAVVRRALARGLRVVGVRRGWLGAVEDTMVEMTWSSVGGILQRGGASLGTARCRRFMTREGRRQAAVHLYREKVDALIVIGGEGSLTGAQVLAREWADLLAEAAALGEIDPWPEEHPPRLDVVGLPGSIDNDIYGSDMSIGADTALHRIVTAADQLTSTAAAHQRTFVVEVMGRHCGYLALAGGLAAGAQWVILPEEELDPRWHHTMVRSLQRGRDAGRQHALVIMAEGARHPDGLPLEAHTVKQILDKQVGETRVTVLGHVQRGGSPTAFDRILATSLGAAAVDYLLDTEDPEPVMMGLVANQIKATPLDEVIANSRQAVDWIEEGQLDAVLDLRGPGFQSQLQLLKILTAVKPQPASPRGNLLILTTGHDAPGMNAAVRVATRVAWNEGYQVWGGQYGLPGLLEGQIQPLGWMDVSGWASRGGSELGTGYKVLQAQDLPALAQILRAHEIQAMVWVGGTSAYLSAQTIIEHGQEFPELHIPLVVVPASINNNLPGSDFAVGADTALNNIIQAVDKIKDTAGANRRVFIVQVMGHEAGYLAILSGLASGAEEVFIPEEGVTLQKILDLVTRLRASFAQGRRLALLILNEKASATYDIEMIRRIMEEEGGEFFDVRSIILGHIQRGGAPTPFDRTLAARLAAGAIHVLLQEDWEQVQARVVGLRGNRLQALALTEAIEEMAWPVERPKDAWYLRYLDLVRGLDIVSNQ